MASHMRTRSRMVRPTLWIALTLLMPQIAIAQQGPCPDNSFYEGEDETNVHCKCEIGYEPRGKVCKPSSRDIVLKAGFEIDRPPKRPQRWKSRAECIGFAGRQLLWELRVCEAPVTSCLKDRGVVGEMSKCAWTQLKMALTLSLTASADPTMLTTVARTVTIVDALKDCNGNLDKGADICGNLWTNCNEEPLKAHKATIATCPG
jgi:hypothetical protein